jgi:WD40 repeat protein
MAHMDIHQRHVSGRHRSFDWRECCLSLRCHSLGLALLLIAVSHAVFAEEGTGLAESKRWVISADFAPDGGSLLTAGGESLLYRPGDVVLWNPADGSRLADLGGHETAVWAARISADGSKAATAGYDGLVKLWDLTNNTSKADLKKHNGWVRSLAFSPDGTVLATAGEDGTVVIWSTADGSEVRTIEAHAGSVTSIAFSPDGSMLATGGGDKLVKLWDAASGEEKGKLEGHADVVWSVAFSPDGGMLASAGADRTLRIWNVAEMTSKAELTGHKDWVTSLAFSPDGSRLASGCLDGSVKLWDVAAAGEQVGPEAAASSVWCVAFSPDGGVLFVGSHEGGRLLTPPEPQLITPPAPPEPPKPVEKVVVLTPAEFLSMAGATAAIAEDGVVAVEGKLAKDTYTIKATTPASGTLKAVKLEVLADDSLPSKGPGRAANGNFVLSTFGLAYGAPGSGETPTVVSFASASADYEQQDYGIANAIDAAVETGWAVAGQTGQSHTATFVLPDNLAVPAEAPLTFTLDQQYAGSDHAIGRLRLSLVMQEPAPPADPKPAEPEAEKAAQPEEQKPDEQKKEEPKNE